MTRDEFRNGVFSRDNNLCVICHKKAVDAHHILERRLFDNGGYDLNNGVSLCEEHHLQAEQTILTCDEIRKAANITKIHLPDHFYKDINYDKWGNIIEEDNERIPGELFYDESVQKILKEGNVLGFFVKHFKYPRTYHLPWSPGATKDDRKLQNTSNFESKNVIVSIKHDGENCNFYNNYIHARSLKFTTDATRAWVKSLHSRMGYNIPEGWRVCGENLYAKHSIHYKNLESYFLIFSIWNEKNECLSWEDTKEWCKLLDLIHVPVIYEGIWDEKLIKNLYKPYFNGDECEGYVVRLTESFKYGDFRKNIAKYVREGHVTTSHHWKYEKMIKNEIKEK